MKNFDISKKPKGVIHFDSELLSKILTQFKDILK